MNIQKRFFQLDIEHTPGQRALTRVVGINQHRVEYKCYRGGAEELILNGTVIARYTAEDMANGVDTFRCSEQFEELTGFFLRDWDRTYRRRYWAVWEGEEWYWDHMGGRRVAPTPRNR